MPPARCCAIPPPHPAAITGQVIVDAILPTRENLIGRLERLSERVDELAETAKVEGRDGVALAGLSEIRKTISDIGRIAGIDRPIVAVQVNNNQRPGCRRHRPHGAGSASARASG